VEIQRSQYIRPKVTVHKCAETIQRRKLFKGGNYSRKYGSDLNGLVEVVPPFSVPLQIAFQIQLLPLLMVIVFLGLFLGSFLRLFLRLFL
jgi:hypothetical protein